MDQRIVVTLIHGTWAKHAPWVECDSPLRATLAAASPNAIAFRAPFRWSSRNSLGARQDAASALRRRILEESIDADVRHFLIAHSHGGNIALYALRDPEVGRRIAGVATLSTPFLIARRRDLGKGGETVVVLALQTLGVFAGYLAYRFMWPNAFFAGVAAFALFAALAFGFLALKKRVDRVVGEMELTTPAAERLWIGRIAGDEAAAGLQTGQLLGWAVAQAHRSFARAYDWAEGMSLARSLLYAAAGLGMVALTWTSGQYLVRVAERPAVVQWAFLAVAAIGFAVFLWGFLTLLPRVVVPLLTVVLLPLEVLLSILLLLPFGLGRALHGVLLDVQSEPTPLGTWTLRQYASTKEKWRPSEKENCPENATKARSTANADKAPKALVHSQIYEHQQALRDLSAWMQECAARTFPDLPPAPPVTVSAGAAAHGA